MLFLHLEAPFLHQRKLSRTQYLQLWRRNYPYLEVLFQHPVEHCQLQWLREVPSQLRERPHLRFLTFLQLPALLFQLREPRSRQHLVPQAVQFQHQAQQSPCLEVQLLSQHLGLVHLAQAFQAFQYQDLSPHLHQEFPHLAVHFRLLAVRSQHLAVPFRLQVRHFPFPEHLVHPEHPESQVLAFQPQVSQLPELPYQSQEHQAHLEPQAFPQLPAFQHQEFQQHQEPLPKLLLTQSQYSKMQRNDLAQMKLEMRRRNCR